MTPPPARIANVGVVSPGRAYVGGYDIILRNGRIDSVTPVGTGNRTSYRTFDATGLIAVPGFIDLHAHLREPGFEHKETVASGLAAAAAGGYAAVCCMANTLPVNDCPAATRLILSAARRCGPAPRLYPIAAVSLGMRGKRLTDFANLRAAGACAFSDDGLAVLNPDIMGEALKTAATLGSFVSAHEDAGAGCAENERESALVERDLRLLLRTGGRLHVAHVSTTASLTALSEAKRCGLAVTAEATPHHLSFTLKDRERLGANGHMHPPLATACDRAALRAAAATGLIDAIATDHAPHTALEKQATPAAAGVIGFETAFSACYRLVIDGTFTLERLVELMATRPAAIIGAHDLGRLIPGMAASVTVFDPQAVFPVEPDNFRSRSRNCPYNGETMSGKIVYVFSDGQLVHEAR